MTSAFVINMPLYLFAGLVGFSLGNFCVILYLNLKVKKLEDALKKTIHNTFILRDVFRGKRGIEALEDPNEKKDA